MVGLGGFVNFGQVGWVFCASVWCGMGFGVLCCGFELR